MLHKAMGTPFVYDKYVTGKDFIGRTDECRKLGELIAQGRSVSIYEPPKAGKTSVIQQTLFGLRLKGTQFITASLSLLNVRSTEDFLKRFGTAVLRSIASTPGEFADLIDRHLGGTHFRFDPAVYEGDDTIISIDGQADSGDMTGMMRLPQRIAADKGQQVLVVIDEFQNIMLTDDGDRICRTMEAEITDPAQKGTPSSLFILCGSMVNAMKEIFETRHLFGRKVEHLEIGQADEREIIDHIVKGFLTGGKIVEKELLLGMCRLFRNNLWYINHFVSICDAMSKGYIPESMLMEGLDAIIAIHEPRFQGIMYNLTSYQVSFLKAVLDGVVKFSAGEVIQKYGLNSSANVKRLRDALLKKEIIVFDKDDIPSLQDPLFEYWVRRYYYEMQ